MTETAQPPKPKQKTNWFKKFVTNISSKKTAADVFNKKMESISVTWKGLGQSPVKDEFFKQIKDLKKKSENTDTTVKEITADLKILEREVNNFASKVESITVEQPNLVLMEEQTKTEGKALIKIRDHVNVIAIQYYDAWRELAKLDAEVKKRKPELFEQTIDQDIEIASDLHTKVGDQERNARHLTRVLYRPIAVQIDAEAAAKGDLQGATDDDLKDLASQLTTHEQQIIKDVQLLKQEINSVKTSNDEMVKLVDDAQNDFDKAKLKKEYLDLKATVDGLITNLEDWEQPVGTQLRKEFKTKTADPTYDQDGVEVLTDLKKKVDDEIKSRKDDYNKKVEVLKQRLTTVETSTEEGLQAVPSQNFRKDTKEEFKKEKEIILAMLENGASDAVLAAAKGMIEELETRAKFLNTDSGRQRMTTLSTHKQKVKDVVKAKDSSKYMPEMTKTLLEEYDELHGSFTTMDGNKAATEWEKLFNKVVNSSTSLQKKVTTKKKWCEDFDKEVKKCESALKLLLKTIKEKEPARKKDDEYRGDLATKLEEAKGLRDTEDSANDTKADKILEDILKQAEEYRVALINDESKASEVIKGQSDGMDKHALEEQNDKTLKKEYEVWRNLHVTAEVYCDGRTDLMPECDAIKNFAKNAKSIMEDTHDLERARKILKSATARTKRLIKLATAKPEEIGGTLEEWGKAHAKMIANIKTIGDKAVEAVKDSTNQSLKDIAKTVTADLSEAANRLKSDAFDAVKDKYDKASKMETGKKKALLRAREEALREVTFLKERLSNDPLLRAAQTNPWGVQAVISPAFTALRKIEHRVLTTI